MGRDGQAPQLVSQPEVKGRSTEIADAEDEPDPDEDLVPPAASIGPGRRHLVGMPSGALPCTLRFGEQVDIQVIGGRAGGDLTPEWVAAYLAKYATKYAEDFGLGERRLSGLALDGVGVSAHVARIVQYRLGSWRGRRAGWAAAVATCARVPRPLAAKSRRYSTTLGAIRHERSDFRRRQVADARPVGIEDQAGDDSTLVVARWQFVGLAT